MSKKDLYKRLYFFSMFDGYLENTGKNARLKVTMLKENADYIDKVATTLEEVPLGYTLREPPTASNHRQTIAIQSKTHPILTTLHQRLYCSGKKAIEPHMLTLLDAEALAIAFMADGNRNVDRRQENEYVAYRLHTNSFTYGDCELFKKAIKEKLFLEFNIEKTGKNGQFNLRLLASSKERFEELMTDFVLPSFLYKLGR